MSESAESKTIFTVKWNRSQSPRASQADHTALHASMRQDLQPEAGHQDESDRLAVCDMESYNKEISDPVHKLKSIHNEVSELYLAKRQLTDVPDLSRFTQLRYIWLNNNRIRDIQGPVFHCCLAELYLQNNEISSITGVLRHLRCLQVLLLHNNHLRNREETVTELRRLQHLQTLNLFLNPFTQDPLYREYTVHHLPSVQLLDRKEVKQEERRRAFKLFSPEKQVILDALAFGRRAPARRKMTQETQRGQWRGKIKCTKCPFDVIDDLCEHRATQRSIMQFSTLDWSSMRSAQQHPLEEQSSTVAKILTVEFG